MSDTLTTEPLPARFTTDLAGRLEARAQPKTREWWQRYLKGTALFRGVPMAGIRTVVDDLWREYHLAEADHAQHIDLALACLRQPPTEDKLAGVLLLAEHVADLSLADLPSLAVPFAEGWIADWNTCDWYCVKVLGRLVARAPDPREAAEAIAAWRTGSPLWQRRAAAVAFVELAPRGDQLYAGFVDLVLTVCASNAQDPARFSQTSVGWLLRELSAAAPERVQRFVQRHQPQLSTEARRTALARLRKRATSAP